MSQTTSPGLRAMHLERADHSKAKVVAAAEAIAAILREELALTVAGIARRAGVSREFIYSHPELVEAIRRSRLERSQRPLLKPEQRGGEAALRAERATLLSRLEALRGQLAERDDELQKLRSQRKEWLGNQLDSMAYATPQPEMRAENERLNARVVQLHRELESALRTISGLEDDLRISREAHAESIAELTRDVTGVSVIRPSQTMFE